MLDKKSQGHRGKETLRKTKGKGRKKKPTRPEKNSAIRPRRSQERGKTLKRKRIDNYRKKRKSFQHHPPPKSLLFNEAALQGRRKGVRMLPRKKLDPSTPGKEEKFTVLLRVARGGRWKKNQRSAREVPGRSLTKKKERGIKEKRRNGAEFDREELIINKTWEGGNLSHGHLRKKKGTALRRKGKGSDWRTSPVAG